MSNSIHRRSLLLGSLGAVAVGSLAACSSGGTATSAPAGGSTGTATGGSASTVDWSKKGPINYVQGKDTSGYVQPTIDKWNALHPDQKVTLVELSDKADDQRQKMVDNATTNGSAKYDVLSVDVVWTAEFAGKQYIVELPKDQFKTDGYLKSAVDACTYFNKLYCFPATSDGALMYYRKDLLDEVSAQAPKTWDEMVATGKLVKAKHADVDILGGQFQKYEGLTCNFTEWVNSAGGKFLDDQGKPQVTSDAALAGVQKMAGFFTDGTIPKAASTWQEEPSRQAFQDGKLLFLRNWPYVYSLASKTDGSSKVVGKFGVAPIPGATSVGVSTLGGHNMAITKTCSNPGTARDFILWWNSQEQQKANLIASSQAPTYEALYSDAELLQKFPYLTALHDSITKAQARPKAVKYGDVTLAIQDTAYGIVQNPSSDAKAAMSTLQTKLQSLTS